MLRDAEAFRAALRRVLPFGHEQNERLLGITRDLVSASVTSTLAIAALQGLIGGVVFALLGIDGWVLWGAMMGILALLPLVGATLVWLPAAVWLALSGSLVKGIVLAAVGVLILGNVDNVVRPLLLSGKAQMNTLVLIISLMGGVSAFGFIGIVLGPAGGRAPHRARRELPRRARRGRRGRGGSRAGRRPIAFAGVAEGLARTHEEAAGRRSPRAPGALSRVGRRSAARHGHAPPARARSSSSGSPAGAGRSGTAGSTCASTAPRASGASSTGTSSRRRSSPRCAPRASGGSTARGWTGRGSCGKAEAMFLPKIDAELLGRDRRDRGGARGGGRRDEPGRDDRLQRHHGARGVLVAGGEGRRSAPARPTSRRSRAAASSRPAA